MSTHLYQLSSKLLGDTIGRMNDSLTSIVLAASAIALALGYISKVMLQQSPDKRLVRSILNQLM